MLLKQARLFEIGDLLLEHRLDLGIVFQGADECSIDHCGLCSNVAPNRALVAGTRRLPSNETAHGVCLLLTGPAPLGDNIAPAGSFDDEAATIRQWRNP